MHSTLYKFTWAFACILSSYGSWTRSDACGWLGVIPSIIAFALSINDCADKRRWTLHSSFFTSRLPTLCAASMKCTEGSNETKSKHPVHWVSLTSSKAIGIVCERANKFSRECKQKRMRKRTIRRAHASTRRFLAYLKWNGAVKKIQWPDVRNLWKRS